MGRSVTPLLSADRLRLSQIFNNLLANAVKFTAPGGNVTLSVDPAREGVRVAVKDTGLGIPANDLPHVFDKYYQASAKATAGESGTGLGLAIVRELVLLHGGQIDVTSEVNPRHNFHRISATKNPRGGRLHCQQNCQQTAVKEFARVVWLSASN